jgi:hypothetical protein
MTPIISPWLIYFISILSSIDFWVTGIFVCCAVTVTIGLLLSPIIIMEWDTIKDRIAEILKAIRLFCTVFIASSFLMVLIPSREDTIAILVASKATPDNYQAVKTEILSLIKEVKNIDDKESE